MNLLNRMKSIFKAKVNIILNDMEDPEEAIEISLSEMRDQLKEIKKALLEVTSIKKRLEDDLLTTRGKIKLTHKQAELSMQAEREDLANAALEKKLNLIEHDEKITKEIKELDGKIIVINENKTQLEKRVKELENKKRELIALNKAADAQLVVKEIVTGVSDDISDINERIERAENKIKQKNAKVSAIDELVEIGGLDILGKTDKIENELKNLQRHEKIKQELELLKLKAVKDGE